MKNLETARDALAKLETEAPGDTIAAIRAHRRKIEAAKADLLDAETLAQVEADKAAAAAAKAAADKAAADLVKARQRAQDAVKASKAIGDALAAMAHGLEALQAAGRDLERLAPDHQAGRLIADRNRIAPIILATPLPGAGMLADFLRVQRPANFARNSDIETHVTNNTKGL